MAERELKSLWIQKRMDYVILNWGIHKISYWCCWLSLWKRRFLISLFLPPQSLLSILSFYRSILFFYIRILYNSSIIRIFFMHTYYSVKRYVNTLKCYDFIKVHFTFTRNQMKQSEYYTVIITVHILFCVNLWVQNSICAHTHMTMQFVFGEIKYKACLVNHDMCGQLFGWDRIIWRMNN